MNKWSPERAEAIRQFIDEYFMENRKSPTVRDIAAGTGISKTSVQRYLTDMKEHGEIEYNGRRSIGTNFSRIKKLKGKGEHQPKFRLSNPRLALDFQAEICYTKRRKAVDI